MWPLPEHCVLRPNCYSCCNWGGKNKRIDNPTCATYTTSYIASLWHAMQVDDGRAVTAVEDSLGQREALLCTTNSSDKAKEEQD